jgi:hypothetical protein
MGAMRQTRAVDVVDRLDSGAPGAQIAPTLIAQVRGRLGVEADPVEAFRRGPYAEDRARERGTTAAESAYETV